MTNISHYASTCFRCGVMCFFSAIPSSRKYHQKSGFGEILLIKSRSRWWMEFAGAVKSFFLQPLVKWMAMMINAENMSSRGDLKYFRKIHRKFVSDHVNHRQRLVRKNIYKVSRLSWIESFFRVFLRPYNFYFLLCEKQFYSKTIKFFRSFHFGCNRKNKFILWKFLFYFWSM